MSTPAPRPCFSSVVLVGATFVLHGMYCGNSLAAPATLLQPVWEREIGNPGEVCSMLRPPWSTGDLQADGAGNLHVLARDRLTSLDPAGDLRWTVSACPGCGDEEQGDLAPMEVAPGGQVWAVETRMVNDYQYRNIALHRISSAGMFTASMSLVGTTFEYAWLLLAADEENAILVRNDATGLYWFGMDASGAATPVQTLAVAVSDHSIGALALQPLPDGDLLFALRASRNIICFPGVPGCWQPDTMVLVRAGFDGVQRWRTDMPSWIPGGTFDSEHRFRFLDAESRLVTVADNGTATIADMPLQNVRDVYSITGPNAGRLLMPTLDALLLLDPTGQLRDAIAVPDPPPPDTSVYPWQPNSIRATPGGFLVPLYANPACDSAVVYHTHQLRERYRLRSPLHACPDNPKQDHGLRVDALAAEDGALTVLHPRCDAAVPRVTVARYALPGTPAGGLLFRDGFDP